MAPITTTTAGVARQIIDDPELISLLQRLCAVAVPPSADEDAMCDDYDEEMTAMIGVLVNELEGIPRWRFQEQVSCSCLGAALGLN
jgi:hypothetical protein